MNKKITLLLMLFWNTCFSQNSEVAVTVLQPQELYLNSSLNITGQTTLVLDVNLPQNTTKWYYTFTASRSKEQIKQTKAQFNLFAQLTRIIDNSGTTAKALSLLNTPPGNDYSNVYLLATQKDSENFNKEFNSKGFTYIREGSRENYVSGVVEVTNPYNLTGRQYLGLHNPSVTFGITVVVEVVAIVKEEQIINGWKKTQKEGLFSNIKNDMEEKHNHHLTQDLLFDLSNCMINKLTIQYSANQFENIPKYELKGIFENIHNQCEQELNLTSKYALKDDLATEDRLVGTWSDENSVFELKANGVFNLKFDDQNTITEGKWEIKKELLTFTINGRKDNYMIEEYSENRFKYRHINDGETFNAERISPEGYRKSIESAVTSNNSPNYTDLLGKWKSDNCSFTLSNNGSILVSWFSGGTTSGIWRLENSLLKVKYTNSNTWSIYKFINFSKDEIRYQETETKQEFKATKIK